MLVTVLPVFLWSFKDVLFNMYNHLSEFIWIILLKKQLGFPFYGKKDKNPSVFLLLTHLFKNTGGVRIYSLCTVVFQLQRNIPTTPRLHPSIHHPSDRIGSKQLIAGAQREELMKFLYISQPGGGILLRWDTRHSLTWRDVNDSLLLFWGW